MTRRAITVVALVCAISAAVPSAALGVGGSAPKAINDCNNHGRLTQQYSPEVLRQALAQMPADVKEYTDCFDVIERQLFKQLGTPGSVSAAGSGSSSSSSLPTWLLVVIVLLALAAVTFGALAIRRRSARTGDPSDAQPDGPGEPPDPDAPPRAGPGGGADDPRAPGKPGRGQGADEPTGPSPSGPDSDAGA